MAATSARRSVVSIPAMARPIVAPSDARPQRAPIAAWDESLDCARRAIATAAHDCIRR